MRTRSTIATSLATSALIMLAACGGSSSDNAGGGKCDNGNPIRIGAVLELTGPVAEVSQQQLEGAQLATKEINAGGGVIGRCLKLISKDSENDPTKAAAVTRELVDREKVDALIGPVNSGPQGASIEVSKETNTLQIVGALANIDYSKYPSVFRAEFASKQVGPGFLTFVKKLGRKRIGIIASNDTFGTSIADSVQATAKEQGVPIGKTEFFDPQSVDLLPQVRSVRDSGADVVVVVATGQTGISLLNARKELKWDAPVLGFSGIATPEIVKGVGADGLKDVYVTLNYKNLVRDSGSATPSDPKVADFIAKLKKARSEDPLTLNVQWPTGGYDMVTMLAKSMEEAKSADSNKVRDALLANGFDGVKSVYKPSKSNHDMIPDDQLAFVLAGTLKDGTLERVASK